MNQTPDYERPRTSVDVALFTLRAGRLAVLLARRDREPFRGSLALPGGYIHADADDDTLATARRVLGDKLQLRAPHLEQLFTFSGKFRDPRGWSMSVAYYAVAPEHGIPATSGGTDIVLAEVDALPALPFDHAAIVAQAVARLRGKSRYSTLAMFLLPDLFTIAEIHAVYQQVMGVALDKVTFRRRIEGQDVIVPVAGMMRGGANRPAQLYRRSDAVLREFAQAL
jgi:8-oxo-dGTP diphosphatase